MGAKAFVIFVFVILALTAYRFIIIPFYQIGDAKVFDAPADFRLGGMVKAAIVREHPEAAEWAISLEPDNSRRGYNMKSAGLAHLYGPRQNGKYDERMICRYSSEWTPGLFVAWPDEIHIESCSTP